MAYSGFTKWMSGATLAAAALVGAGSAQAAVYTGEWDPAYGAPFTNLGWRGAANFEIPDACGTTGTVFSFNCAGMKVVSATVEFYDTSYSGPLSEEPTLATLSWVNPAATVNLATFSGGVLSAISTSYLSPGQIPASSFEKIDSYTFYLEFLTTGARLTHIYGGAPDATDKSCARDFEGVADDRCGYSSLNGSAVPMTFTVAIPEPQTYALMLFGLAAVGFAARRRRR